MPSAVPPPQLSSAWPGTPYQRTSTSCTVTALGVTSASLMTSAQVPGVSRFATW